MAPGDLYRLRDKSEESNAEVAAKTWPDDHLAVQRIEKSIMDLMRPHSIVEGDVFKRLNFADHARARRYETKSEKYSERLFCR